jgi:hypothetical protein
MGLSSCHEEFSFLGFWILFIKDMHDWISSFLRKIIASNVRPIPKIDNRNKRVRVRSTLDKKKKYLK